MTEEINVTVVELDHVVLSLTEPAAIDVTITGAVPPPAVGNLKSGLDAAKSVSPSKGDVYLATDTGIFYLCFTAGTWIIPFILSLPFVGEYKIRSIKFADDGTYVVEYDNTPIP